MSRSSRHRIVVAGAGPVGLAAAAAILSTCRRDKLELLVVDPGQAPVWRRGQTDLRVYALSRSTERLLRGVDAWGAMAERGLSPYERMRVWEGSNPQGPGSLEFDCADVGEPNLGYIGEDAALRDVLTARVLSFENAAVKFGVGIGSVRPGANGVEVTLSSAERIDASLLIGADGAHSPIRKMLGLTSIERNYRQHALVTHVGTQLPHERIARQRFLPTGPVAFLPLLDGRSSVVWSADDSVDLRSLAGRPDALIEALQKASADVLGTITDASECAVFALLARHAPRYCLSRVALIGDAAHTVHPLAGQGMNLGFLDAGALAQEIALAVESGHDPGDLKVLRRYERARKGGNLGMLIALDALDRLFRAGDRAGGLRTGALALIDRTRPAKHVLMKRALGLPGRLDDRLAQRSSRPLA